MCEIETLARQTNFEWGIAENALWIRDLVNGGKPFADNAENVLQYINQHVPVKDYSVAYTNGSDTWKIIELQPNVPNNQEPCNNLLFKRCSLFKILSFEKLLLYFTY